MNTAKQIGGAPGLAVLITLTADPGASPQTTASGYGHVFVSIAAMLIMVAALPARCPHGRAPDGYDRPKGSRWSAISARFSADATATPTLRRVPVEFLVDRDLIALRRTRHHQLGFAVQMCTVRYVGRFLVDEFEDTEWGRKFRSFLHGRAWTHAEGPVALFNQAAGCWTGRSGRRCGSTCCTA